MSQPIEVLLFDLGGVVIDVDFERTIAAWARMTGVPTAELRARIVVDEHWHAYECGRMSDDAFFAHVGATLPLPLTHAQLVDGWNAIFGGEIAGVAALLRDAAAAMPVYAFSNTNRVHELWWSERYRTTLAPFREIFVSSTIGLRKPDRAAFDHVTAAIGIAPERVLFLDDLADNVAGARAAGLQAALIRGPADTTAAVAAALARAR